jgi:hypothetical protein
VAVHDAALVLEFVDCVVPTYPSRTSTSVTSVPASLESAKSAVDGVAQMWCAAAVPACAGACFCSIRQFMSVVPLGHGGLLAFVGPKAKNHQDLILDE